MTVTSTISRVAYAGNSSTTVFSFPYFFLANADLVVISRDISTGVETLKTITTDYTVLGATSPSGGSVTMLVTPTTGTSLTIYRSPALTQGLDLVENDPMPAESLEKADDLAMMGLQRLSDRVDRSLRLSEGFNEAFDPTLPPLINTPLTTLAVNSSGTGFVLGPTSDQVSTAQASAIAAAASATLAAAYDANANAASAQASFSDSSANAHATAAATSAASAATQAANSATSATASATSATASAASAASVTGQAAAAAASAADALTSQNAAATSATGAATSATTSSTQATASGVSAAAALVSQNAAATSASGATTSATNAATSATNSATSATAAAGSATTATTQAGISTTQAGNSATSATASGVSAAAALVSQNAAASSATGAATSQSAAATSATGAATSATNAATSATSAALSATAAAATMPMTTGGDMIYGGTSGVPTRLPNGAVGQLLQSNGTTLAPTWVAAPSTSPLSTKGDLYGYSTTNARLPVGTNGQSLQSDSAQTLGVKWNSPVIAPAASTNAAWDANKNLSANNVIPGFRTQATANSTLTLVIGDAELQYFTGSTAGQIVQLPTTSIVAGMGYSISNNSSVSVAVNSSGSNLVQTIPAGASATFTALVATPTTAANWNVVNIGAGVSVAPTVQKFLSGSGTYTTPTNPAPLFISVEVQGGGGGGGGSGTSPGTGGTGGVSTFGSSLLTANGGVGSANGGGTNAGGTATGGDINISGGQGDGASTIVNSIAGRGGNSYFGGGGGAGGSSASVVGGAAATNSGGGGGGAGSSTSQIGGGGGAGGYCSKIITSPSATYACAVGAAGTAGGAGSSGAAGGLGGSGQIIVTEFYPVVGTVAAAVAGIAPTVQKFTSSSGTYTTPAGVQWIRVRAVGGGGGGGGDSGTNAGGTGGNTTFGTSLIVANGGVGGLTNNSGGAGGTASLGTGPIGTALQGGQGMGLVQVGSGGFTATGGAGASSPFGGAGVSTLSNAGIAAIANTGSGGGGAGPNSTVANKGGAGGGAGGFVDAIITSPSATYAYAVGAAGAAGTAGAQGFAGGAGGSGYIEVIEYYNGLAVGTTAAVTAGYVLAGPTSGGSAAPTFRALVIADLPAAVCSVGVTNAVSPGANAVIKYDTVIVDALATYSASTGLFTCPATKNYRISVTVLNNATANAYIKVNGTAKAVLCTALSGAVYSGSVILPLTLNDTVGIYGDGAATYTAISGSVGYYNTLCIEAV